MRYANGQPVELTDVLTWLGAECVLRGMTGPKDDGVTTLWLDTPTGMQTARVWGGTLPDAFALVRRRAPSLAGVPATYADGQEVHEGDVVTADPSDRWQVREYVVTDPGDARAWWLNVVGPWGEEVFSGTMRDRVRLLRRADGEGS